MKVSKRKSTLSCFWWLSWSCSPSSLLLTGNVWWVCSSLSSSLMQSVSPPQTGFVDGGSFLRNFPSFGEPADVSSIQDCQSCLSSWTVSFHGQDGWHQSVSSFYQYQADYCLKSCLLRENSVYLPLLCNGSLHASQSVQMVVDNAFLAWEVFLLVGDEVDELSESSVFSAVTRPVNLRSFLPGEHVLMTSP